MQQLKLFKSIEAEVSALEREINEWIRDSNANIISVTGNISPQSGSPASLSSSSYVPSDILIIVLYEDGT